MSYDTEKNRIKVTKYRARKGLRDAGYDEDDVEEIMQSVTDWAQVTAQDLLNQYVDYSDSARAATTTQAESTGGSSPWGWIAGGIILGGAIILGIVRGFREA